MASWACQKIVVIDIHGVIGVLGRFTDENIKQAFTEQVINDRIILSGIQKDKTVCFATACHRTHGLQDFFFILSCYNGADILVAVAVVADSPDGFQIKGIFVCFFGRSGQNDANAPGIG